MPNHEPIFVRGEKMTLTFMNFLQMTADCDDEPPFGIARAALFLLEATSRPLTSEFLFGHPPRQPTPVIVPKQRRDHIHKRGFHGR
jgi:hypothetical protein